MLQKHKLQKLSRKAIYWLRCVGRGWLFLLGGFYVTLTIYNIIGTSPNCAVVYRDYMASMKLNFRFLGLVKKSIFLKMVNFSNCFRLGPGFVTFFVSFPLKIVTTQKKQSEIQCLPKVSIFKDNDLKSMFPFVFAIHSL